MVNRDKDIFLSYRNDGTGQNFAARLEKDLSDAGYSVYFNPNEMGASDFPDRLRKAISRCSDFIAICTKDYLKRLKKESDGSSNWIREELLTAHVSKCKITPILVGGAKIPSNAAEIPEDMRWFCSIDAITMPDQYLATPFSDLKRAITAKPDKDDLYKHTENSNPFFQTNPEYADILGQAEEGNPEAMLTTAVMCYYGFCGKRDYESAEKWLRKIPGDPPKLRADADNLLAHMYYSGQIARENQSYEKSYEYHKKASGYNSNSLAEASFAERFGIGCQFNYSEIENHYRSVVSGNSDTISHLEFAGFLEAYGKWQDAAEQYKMIVHASREAAYRLGLLYKKGVLVDPPYPDYSAAVSLLKPLVSGEYPHIEAAYELGMCYARPTGEFSTNFREAKRFFVIAADHGHTEASYMAGFLFENSLAGPDKNNTTNAIKYYEIAANAGHALAALQLAKLYQEKNSFTNYHRAYRYAVAAVNGGIAEGNMILGNLLLFGRGCEPNTNYAYRCYSTAAEAGIFSAELMMKVIKQKFEDADTEKAVNTAYYLYDSEKEEDLREAFDILNRYSQTNGKAANLLGLMYHHGHVVDQDDRKAVELFHRAADAGYRAAYCNLADAYFFGAGVEKDYSEAAEYYRLAADTKDECGEGDHDAEANYGHMLYLGIGVSKDNALAKEYLHRSAYYYTPQARYNLALIYEEEKNFEKALYWFTRAAECHVTESYIKLCVYYRDGIGTQVDVIEAKKWCDMACAFGYQGNIDNLKFK